MRKGLKEWVKEKVGRRCEDSILWGRWEDEGGSEGSAGVKEKKNKQPQASQKRIKELGEPVRKTRRQEPKEEGKGEQR